MTPAYEIFICVFASVMFVLMGAVALLVLYVGFRSIREDRHDDEPTFPVAKFKYPFIANKHHSFVKWEDDKDEDYY